jgi:hypothetical protein
MSHTVTEIHTWNCSIPKCLQTITAYTVEYAADTGWWTDVTITANGAFVNPNGEVMDLCPDHVKILKAVLFDEEQL